MVQLLMVLRSLDAMIPLILELAELAELVLFSKLDY